VLSSGARKTSSQCGCSQSGKWQVKLRRPRRQIGIDNEHELLDGNAFWFAPEGGLIAKCEHVIHVVHRFDVPDAGIVLYFAGIHPEIG
jgi:hypothetical protein